MAHFERMSFFGRQTLFVATFALVTSLFCKLLLHFDINRRSYNHVPGECGTIPNLPGARDFATTTTHGKLFMIVNPITEISSTNTHLFTYDADKKTAKEVDLDKKRNLTALRLYGDKLFAYDELSTNVLVYKISETNETLKLRKRFRNRMFKGLIGLAPTDSASFYYIKNEVYESEIINIFSRFFPFPKTGQLLLFEKQKSKMISDIAYPTDLAYDDFKKVLYIASYSKNSIITYSGENSDKKMHYYDIGCAPTSIWLDIDGSLLVTCHPIRMKVLVSYLNPDLKNPSMVLRITIGKRPEDLKISQLYSNDGATISEAYRSVRAGRNVLISNSKFILNCEI